MQPHSSQETIAGVVGSDDTGGPAARADFVRYAQGGHGALGGDYLRSEISQEQAPEVALLPLWVRIRPLEVSDPKRETERGLIEKASGLSMFLERTGHASAYHAFRKDDDEVFLNLAKRLENAKMRKVLDHDLLEALVPNAKVHRDVDHLVEHGLQRLSFERVADQLEPPQPIVGEMSNRRNQ